MISNIIYVLAGLFTAKKMFPYILEEVSWSSKIEPTDVALTLTVAILAGALWPFIAITWIFYILVFKPIAQNINERNGK